MVIFKTFIFTTHNFASNKFKMLLYILNFASNKLKQCQLFASISREREFVKTTFF